MTFAAVHSTSLAPACPEQVAAALLRRFCETKAELWSERASRAREYVGVTR